MIRSHVKQAAVCVVSSLLWVGVAAPVNGDWLLDFGTPLPPEVDTRNVDIVDMPSPTYTTTVGGGILTLSDTNPTNAAGAQTGLLWHDGEVFTNVRVTGTLNPAGNSADILALVARGDSGLTNGYSVGFNFATGQLFAGKVINDSIPFNVFSDEVGQGSQPPLTDLSRSYYLENEAIGNEITGRLYDAPGGTELLKVQFTDTDLGGVPPHETGISGLAAFQFPTPTDQTLTATYDDVRSTVIPEPGSGLLVILALVAMAGINLARRNLP